MQQVRAVVSAELDAVNAVIIEQLRSDVDMVENVGQYIVDAGGKRLRPVLVLLSAAALGAISDTQIRFAAVVEFIHTATLLHDDVVDVSELRRGRPTANSAFGNAPSVLVGDFLYTRAFQLMVALGNHDVLKMMADTTNTIAAGEVLQLIRAGDAATSEEQYYDVIDRKTAALFAAGCEGAALLAGADATKVEQLRVCGRNIGVAFQLVDDLLDYEGDPEVTGKNVGDDLAEGKPTLPLIHVMREGSEAQANLVREAINTKDRERLQEVIQAVRDCGSLDYTRNAALHCRDQALKALDGLPDSPAKDALARLAALSIQRSH
ncbi:polyprenyl synthetase family protein [Congregibacter variabilis]|uniref:Polyprenyl synthetase family protein n=1 Tax=Congregibacter variabilis TaxID=3081200 RepID=A0ABZ0I168_9GAMM|nr:polyprenyl synthetase family protein [Congregibacter sp. IMCC43200]